jgi:hypothetical protein
MSSDGRPQGDASAADLPADPGLCLSCQHAKISRTNRQTVYLRCTRAAWDDRLDRYPRLPVISCVGYESE